MSDSPNPAPAGAGDAPARLSENDLLEQLGRFGDDGSLDDGDTSAEEEPKEEAEPTEPEADDAPAGDDEATEDEGSEDEGPEDDASEPEQEDEAKAKDAKDDKLLVSRDGEKVKASELWKARDRAREFDRVLPKIQQEYQGFQQARQSFEAEKQQFKTLATSVAQLAFEQLPAAPDPALMDENSGKYDPILFMQQQHRRQSAEANLNSKLSGAAQALSQETEQAKQQATQRTQALRQNAVQQFFAAHPEYQAPEKGQEFARDFHRVADVVGYSKEERADVLDPRLYRLTLLAGRGLKAMEAVQVQISVTTQRKTIAAKKVAQAPAVTPPAARQSAAARDTRVMQANVERLRKNPSSTEAQLAALAQFD